MLEEGRISQLSKASAVVRRFAQDQTGQDAVADHTTQRWQVDLTWFAPMRVR
jgi:hypothetical protein